MRSVLVKAFVALVLAAGCLTPAAAQRAEDRVTISGSGSGAFETPAVAGGATGWARCDIDRANRQIDCTARVFNIVDLIAAHMHAGGPGVAGNVILPIPNLPLRISDDFTLSWTWREADLQRRPGDGINKFDDAIESCSSGNCYLNFHTTSHPGGEMRIPMCPESRSANNFTGVDICHP